ncbi:MAG: membrane protein insertase YidC [Oscillospiraceae bacterium]|nr:membrane protein insertase YidC [Oscillospiraceae bacterium]
MWLIYRLVNDFGWAVVLFTLLVKVVSFPLQLKQQKNQAFSQLFTPRVQEIQRKHRGNQQKMQEEMAKLQKEGYNPMGGCGPMLLTVIILFGVLDVVYKPMTHMERLDGDTIARVQEISKQVEYTSIVLKSEEDARLFVEFSDSGEDFNDFFTKSEDVEQVSYVLTSDSVISVTEAQRKQIGELIFDSFDNRNNSFLIDSGSRLSETVKGELRGVEGRYKSLQRELRAVAQYSISPDAFSSLSAEDVKKLENLNENLLFLGVINLGETPNFTTFNSLWFIAMLCFVLSVIQTVVMRYIQKKTMPDAPNMGAMKFMFFMGPMFSLMIVFTVPAGAGLYWAVSYMFMIVQSIIIYKLWPPERMREEARAKVTAKGGVVNAVAKVVDVDEEGNEVIKEEKVYEMSSKEQKEYFRKKLEEARKADLEKYGEAPDIDLSEYDKPKPKNEGEDAPVDKQENIDN